MQVANVDQDHLAVALDNLTVTSAAIPEMEAQLQAACEAFLAIARSGVVGSGPITGTLSGHANPDHEPRTGWANDMVMVTVHQAQPESGPQNAAEPSNPPDPPQDTR